MKTAFKKSKPKIITYRSYKSFSNDRFREALQQIECNENNCNSGFGNFISSCNRILDEHAPQKKRYLRGNQSPFMNKTLVKAIMVRSKLRNVFLKNKTEENRSNYSKQRSLCLTLLQKSKKEYFGNLNEKNLCDNKKFWSVVKLLLSNKVVSNEKIILVENDKKSATVLNNFFSNIIKSLGIPQYKDAEPVGQNISDPVLKTIIKYRSHPSIKAIKEQCNTNLYFSFSQIGNDEIMKELNNLDTNKAIQNTDIPTKLINENSDIFENFIFENLNSCISHSIFPISMKN